LYPQLQSPFTGKRRAWKYGRARVALPPPSGRIGDGSTHAALELMADLRALISAGLIEPLRDGRTIRYGVADANQHPT
jgi:hypothetical protein